MNVPNRWTDFQPPKTNSARETNAKEAAMAGESQPLRNLIDGDPAAGDGEERMAVLNPATGQELWNAPVSEVEDVDRAVAAARRAFADWSRRTPAERSQALLALAGML